MELCRASQGWRPQRFEVLGASRTSALEDPVLSVLAAFTSQVCAQRRASSIVRARRQRQAQ